MKILVIGGSYFLGRVFVLLTHQKYELTLLNRGNYSMQNYVSQEYALDRHDSQALASLPSVDYDVVIDLCAYQKGDIETFCHHFPGTFKHYILISTVDVYKHRTQTLQTESSDYEDIHYAGEIGQYIDGKIDVEKELIHLSNQHGFRYTILRPGMIYGPFNYAPRESALIQRAMNNQPLYHFSNANGHFQLVYVQDVVKAMMKVIDQPTLPVFNIVSPEKLTYHMVAKTILNALNKDTTLMDYSLEKAMQEGYPLPFALMKEEIEEYDSTRFMETYDFQYTPFESGMEKTVQALIPVFNNQ